MISVGKKSSLFSSSDSYYSLLVHQVYKSLMTREWCSHATELARFYNISEDEVKTRGKKSFDGYGELKKAFTDVLKALKERCPSSIEEVIFKKEKKVRYTGDNNDPFAEERAHCRQQTIEDYVRFCNGSLGLLPPGWFSSFFSGTRQLGDAKREIREGNVFISASHEQNLKNIELLPKFYRHIENKEATTFMYAAYGKDAELVIFHPQYLKEFNDRWFVIGPRQGSEHPVDVIPLDRIEGSVDVSPETRYIAAKSGFYRRYFDKIVGVTHENNRRCEHITIKTRSRYVHGLMKTKPVHTSFTELAPYSSYEDDAHPYGMISYDLEPNREFFGRILSFGPDLEVVGPAGIRDEFKAKAEHLARMYGIRTEESNK